MADPPSHSQDTDNAFRNAQSLTVSEVAIILQNYVQHVKIENPEYQPNMLLAKTLDYAHQFALNRNKETLDKMRRYASFFIVRPHCRSSLPPNNTLYQCSFLKTLDFTEEEIAMVCSLQIGTAEEAKKLIPTLQRFSDDNLQRWLADIETWRSFE